MVLRPALKHVLFEFAGIESDGLSGGESVAALKQMRMIQIAEFVFLLIVVWAMIVKPGA